MGIGVSHDSLLKHCHPAALTLYNHSSSLKFVPNEIRAGHCRKDGCTLGGSSTSGTPGGDSAGASAREMSITAGGATLSVPAGGSSVAASLTFPVEGLGTAGCASGRLRFSKVKPMLAQRLSFWKIPRIFGAGGRKALQEAKFLVETKYDGERLLVHLDRNQRRVVLCTRTGRDDTELYGPSTTNIFLQHTIGRRLVLDGEI